MKILITENQKEKIALNWLNKNFSPDLLEIVEKPSNPKIIFYKKNGEVMMELDTEEKYVFFDFNEIWTFFRNMFSMEENEIRSLLKFWLKTVLNLEGYRVHHWQFSNR